MATVEHCLYCFEALAASLERRTPLSLDKVQSLWAEYPKKPEEDEELGESSDDDGSSENEAPAPVADLVPRNPTLQRVSGSHSTSTGSFNTASSSSSSLSSSTTGTTPAGSESSFSPTGHKRAATITESPLFVTWNTISGDGSRSLRGCIGTFEPRPLADGLSSYALMSAFSDHRFNPIARSELPTLEACVTLLTDFETAKDPMDWEIGVHGIRISFYARNKRFGACYLPDVPVEQGWDKEETMVSLMRKAGWGGRREKWSEVDDLKVVRFQGLAVSLEWDEFRKWKEWVDKRGK